MFLMHEYIISFSFLISREIFQVQDVGKHFRRVHHLVPFLFVKSSSKEWYSRSSQIDLERRWMTRDEWCCNCLMEHLAIHMAPSQTSRKEKCEAAMEVQGILAKCALVWGRAIQPFFTNKLEGVHSLPYNLWHTRHPTCPDTFARSITYALLYQCPHPLPPYEEFSLRKLLQV